MVTESEWVDYQACPRDRRHVLLGDGCRLCEQPAPPSRELTTVGKFHWLCWQQQLDWADRFRPDQVLELTSADFVAWAEADPTRHQQYLGFLGRSATFAPADFPRSTRGYLLSPGRPSTTVILQPDGTIVRPEHPGPGRWGCDPAGVLVLNIDHTQYRLVGDRGGLHTGRRVAHGVDDRRAGAARSLVGRGHRHRHPVDQPLGHRARPPVRRRVTENATSSSGAGRG